MAHMLHSFALLYTILLPCSSGLKGHKSINSEEIKANQASSSSEYRERSARNCFFPSLAASGATEGGRSSEPLPRISGNFVLNHSTVAPYWSLSCPFEVKEYSCALSGKQHAQNAEQSRALQFIPIENGHCSFDAFDGERFLRALGSRHLEFIGDSVTQQHFIATACRLLRWVDWRETNRFWLKSHVDISASSCSQTEVAKRASDWGCRPRYLATMRGDSRRSNQTSCIFFRVPGPRDITVTRMCFRGPLTRRVAALYLRSRFGSNVVVVASAGREYPDAYRATLRTMLSSINARGCRDRPFLLWREHVAEHTWDASSRRPHTRRSSSPCQQSITRKSSSHTRVLIERQELMGHHIPTLRTFDSSVMLGWAHVGDSCIFYCMPGLPDFWSTLLHNALAQLSANDWPCYE